MRIEDYLRELKKIELLSPETEAGLWEAFKKRGDEAARGRLIQSYQPLVFKCAAPYRSLENVMDIVQEGTVGLIEAAESFDHERGVAFSLFAIHRIRGRMIDFMRREGVFSAVSMESLTDERGVSIAESIEDTSPAVSEQAESRELVRRLREALVRLPMKERIVIEEVCLGNCAVPDIADRLNVSTAHVYRLQQNGIRRVRGMLSRFMNAWRKG